MTWTNDNGAGTSSGIPVAVRRAVRRRDGDACQLRYAGCTGRYEEFDHKVGIAVRGIARTDALTVDELQCVCRACHRIKTQLQAQAGRGRAVREPERDHRIGPVVTPTNWRYQPPNPNGVRGAAGQTAGAAVPQGGHSSPGGCAAPGGIGAEILCNAPRTSRRPRHDR